MKRKLLSVLGFAAAGLGVYLLYSVFERQDFAALAEAVANVPFASLLLTFACTVASFACLASIEFLGVRYTKTKASTRRIVATAVAALGTGQTLGLAALSSGAIRYRMYSRIGADLVMVGKLVVFTGVTVAMGLATVGGATLLWQDDLLAGLIGISDETVSAVGFASLAVVVVYLGICRSRLKSVGFRRWRLDLPSFRTACGQVVFGSLNLVCVAGALYAALRSFVPIGYGKSLSMYLGTDLSAVIGHVPGGWGVLEQIVTHAIEDPKALAGVIVFRAVYHLVPLLAGLGIFLGDETLAAKQKRKTSRGQATGFPPVARAVGGD